MTHYCRVCDYPIECESSANDYYDFLIAMGVYNPLDLKIEQAKSLGDKLAGKISDILQMEGLEPYEADKPDIDSYN